MKIMFVCHGNICRSPMAEFILKDMAIKNGLNLEISSSATSGEEVYNGIGNPVYPPAKRELAKHGISADGKRAKRLKKEDYKCFDYFIGMDSANIRNMRLIFDGDNENKIRKLLNIANVDADVSDPWYTDRFDVCYQDIYKGCKAIMNKIINGEEL